MITLNGKPESGFDGRLLTELLTVHSYRTELIAVEYNGEILPKSSYGDTVLKDGDSLEVVSFVGGG